MLSFQQQRASTHKEDGRKLLTASSIKGMRSEAISTKDNEERRGLPWNAISSPACHLVTDSQTSVNQQIHSRFHMVTRPHCRDIPLARDIQGHRQCLSGEKSSTGRRMAQAVSPEIY